MSLIWELPVQTMPVSYITWPSPIFFFLYSLLGSSAAVQLELHFQSFLLSWTVFIFQSLMPWNYTLSFLNISIFTLSKSYSSFWLSLGPCLPRDSSLLPANKFLLRVRIWSRVAIHAVRTSTPGRWNCQQGKTKTLSYALLLAEWDFWQVWGSWGSPSAWGLTTPSGCQMKITSAFFKIKLGTLAILSFGST